MFVLNKWKAEMVSLVIEKAVFEAEKQGWGHNRSLILILQVYLNIQVLIPVGSLINKSQVLGSIMDWRFKTDGI